ncbi:MAG: competence/damage-inducible protein A [Gemmatimonadetes bacterium]|nr:competence/damage-inducible protein A [Gemmatimonadota bacterium]
MRERSPKNLEIVTIGEELLAGATIDTNAAVIALAVETVGWRVARRTTVGDDGAAIREGVSQALERHGAVICTGGLGPTRDDMTKRAVAALFGRTLRFDEVLWEDLRARWQRLGRPIPESNRSQAEVPEDATVFPNPKGTAPGLALLDRRGFCVCLPGVPAEMQAILEGSVLAWLGARGGTWRAHRRLLRSTGVPEAEIADRVAPVLERFGGVEVAYLPDPVGVDLRLTVWSDDARDAQRLLDEAEGAVRGALGSYVYTTGERDLAEIVGEILRERRWRLAVAESCTGGLLGERITAVPGSSDYFWGGVIAYDNAAKMALLGVPPAIVEAHGAVSGETATAMARAVRECAGAEVGVAVTGIAGPAGGTPEKPVGTVWLAVSAPMGERAVHRHYLGDRSHIRNRAAQGALEFVRRCLLGLEP